MHLLLCYLRQKHRGFTLLILLLKSSSETLTNSKACGKIVDLILFEAEKALDAVAHRRLLIKLVCYRILLSWIKSFISNRQQRVVLGDAVSDWCEVSSGVP